MAKESKVKVFVGTRKGGFIFTSDEKRKKWDVSELMFKSWEVMHMQLDPRDGRLHASANHPVYGPTTHYSDDLGKSWTQAKQVPAFTRPSQSGRPIGSVDEASQVGWEAAKLKDVPEKVIRTWHIEPGRNEEAGTYTRAFSLPPCLSPRIAARAGTSWKVSTIIPSADSGTPARAAYACTPSCSTPRIHSACTWRSQRRAVTVPTMAAPRGSR